MTRAFAETSTRTPSIRAMLVLLVGVWLALQGWLLTAHWINADEGAHLMDARLVLEGLIPEVDFHARQPLYVYAYVPFLRLFGVGYVAGRLMPVLATLLSAGVLFLIGRRLWGRMEGWCAAILYLWAPTILIDTAVVKTEPLAILLTALGLLGVVASIQRRHWWFLFAAGVAFGAGYYVRESTLAGLVVSGLILLAQAREGLGVLAKRLAVLGFGFGAVCLGVIACYARSLPLAQLLSHEGLFPFYRILVSVARILGWWSPSPASGMGEVVRWSSQTWFDTTRNLEDALSLNLPFLAGVIAAGWYGVSALVRRRSSQAVSADQELRGVGLGFAWLGSTALLYTYHIVSRGFFQYYFREFLPPMALLLAFVLVRALREMGMEQRALVALLISLAACAGAFVILRVVGWRGGGVLSALLAVGLAGWMVFHEVLRTRARLVGYLMGCVVALGGFVVLKFTSWAGGPYHIPGGGFLALETALIIGVVWILAKRVARRPLATFLALAAVSGASLLSVAYGARVLSPAYDCEWSPQAVKDVTRLIVAHSTPHDEVLSGAMIWELASGRRPFMNISHPLGFMDEMPSETAHRIAQRLGEQPPKLIVLDGYTELTYLKRVPRLSALLTSSYRLVGEVPGPVHRVQVFALVARE